MDKNQTIKNIKAASFKSKYTQGVQQYALELVDYYDQEELADVTESTLLKKLMRGAKTWMQFSQGAGSLVTDKEIIERLYDGTQKELYLKRLHSDEYDNMPTYWLDKQATALAKAALMVEINYED